MNYCQGTSPDDKQTMCLICQTEYNIQLQSENIVKIIDCNHIYHAECINEWFKYNEACPICRKYLGNKSESPSLFQYILLYLSLQYPTHEDTSQLHTYTSQSLSNSAFTCVFLNILLERYKTAAEYNSIKPLILQLKSNLIIDNESLPSDINASSRTAIIREIKHRQTLMRSLLVQWLWSEADPYHTDDPPELPHGRALYSHPYLQSWRRKIETAIIPHLSSH
jgi:hypothetical protein